MGLNRYAKRRDANERTIIQALQRVGVSVWQIDQPADLLCRIGARFFVIEVKDPDKPPSQRRLTKAQEEFFLEAGPAPVFKVETEDEALEAVAEVREWGRVVRAVTVRSTAELYSSGQPE